MRINGTAISASNPVNSASNPHTKYMRINGTAREREAEKK
jgi:hypothetical protein